jgi:uncharacterized membrane protein
MSYFNEEERLAIKRAIENAESQTSGEVCICVEKYCDSDAMQRALEYFHKLNMTQTKLRNGVLIYVAMLDKVFAVVGDEGIHREVGHEFWENARLLLSTNFKNGDIVKGIVETVDQIGKALSHFFPKLDDDINELPDEIIYGDV